MDPDRLAELEEERRFLLGSIRDLEKEHEAGDVDEADFTALRDGYVARAAAVLREIEDGRSALPAKPVRPWWRKPQELPPYRWRRQRFPLHRLFWHKPNKQRRPAMWSSRPWWELITRPPAQKPNPLCR